MNHIEIYVANLANTVQFYHWLLVCNLEFELDTHWVNGVTFRQGDCYLVFVEVAKEKQSMGYNRTHIGLNHLAFWATSRLKVDQIHDQLTIMNPQHYFMINCIHLQVDRIIMRSILKIQIELNWKWLPSKSEKIRTSFRIFSDF